MNCLLLKRLSLCAAVIPVLCLMVSCNGNIESAPSKQDSSADTTEGNNESVLSTTDTSQAASQYSGTEQFQQTDDAANTDGIKMYIAIGDTTLTATMEDNTSVEALLELLKDKPITVNMRDYGNMEKVGDIGTNLPSNDEQITTEPGDLILFQGNSFVIYYEPNSWSFTRLGKIDGATKDDLIEIMGNGDVSITLSLMN